MYDHQSLLEDLYGPSKSWVAELHLSNRSENAILESNITSLAQLMRLSYIKLLDIPGLGKVGAAEIRNTLRIIKKNHTSKSTVDAAPLSNVTVNITDNIHQDTLVTSLGLSVRTVNALQNNRIETISDLAQYSLIELSELRGLGAKSCSELEQLAHSQSQDGLVILKEPVKISLDEFLSTKLNKSYLAIYDSYYGLTSSQGKRNTLQDVADEYKVTRERIRQIVKKCSVKVIDAMNNGTVDATTYEILLTHSNRPVQLLPELSNIYRKEALVNLFTDTRRTGLRVVRQPKLRSQWVIDDKYDIAGQVKIARQALRSQVSPVSISELAVAFDIDEDILYDLEKVTITNSGLIVLNSNKQALGLDVRQEIIEFMDSEVKPVTIQAVMAALGLTETQVRGRLHSMQEVVNVGLSTYALRKYGYTGESIAELAERLLKEENAPIHISRIVSFVNKNKIVEDSSIPTMLSAHPEVFANIGEGYYALVDQGYISTGRRIKYDTPPDEAVMTVLMYTKQPMSVTEILNRVKERFGDQTTDKYATVAAACTRLYEQDLLTKLGTHHSTFYKLKNTIEEN